MSNLAKLEFTALDATGKNYMSWTIDVEFHLQSLSLTETIKESNTTSVKDKATAMVFLRKHIDESLKIEYMDVKDPKVLWKDLKDRFDHQKDMTLPMVRDEWNNLRFQDFEKVNDYNSAMHRIASHMRYCGETITDKDMLEKTYSTFHKSHMTLMQQYRLRGYTKYSELSVALLVAEKNSELLIKNHQSRPTGSKAFPEVNANVAMTYGHGRGRGRGRGRGYGRGRGRGSFYGQQSKGIQKRPTGNYHNKDKGDIENASCDPKDCCYKCGTKGHWSRDCRIPKHLCDLYMASVKGKEKEANFTENPDDSVHLDALDFTDDYDVKIIGD